MNRNAILITLVAIALTGCAGQQPNTMAPATAVECRADHYNACMRTLFNSDTLYHQQTAERSCYQYAQQQCPAARYPI